MKCNEDLLYIEDAKKRKLYYRFTPASLISNFTPLLVVLHDKAQPLTPSFEYKMWNILTPLDNFGHENRGSLWLGEKGDFFVKDLLQELISQISQEYECEDHIYLYGSGMGGFGAILHGVLCQANTVYACDPLIRLADINDTNSHRKQFYDAVFTQTLSKENDLSNYLNATDTVPLFYLCDNGNADKNSLENETAYFADTCEQHGIKFHLDHCPQSEGDETHSLKKVLDMLERMTP